MEEYEDPETIKKSSRNDAKIEKVDWICLSIYVILTA